MNELSIYLSVCARFKSSVWISDDANMIWTSDIRIKKDLEDIDDDIALQKILQIEPKTYRYIDETRNGEHKVIGFISQQIEQVLPEATSKQTGLIPNILELCNISSNIINLSSNIDTSTLNGSNMTSNVRVILEDGTDKLLKYSINGSNMILEENLNTSNVYVYGTEINDITTIEKTYIYTLNVCATQVLSRKIDALQLENQILNDKINMLSNYLFGSNL